MIHVTEAARERLEKIIEEQGAEKVYRIFLDGFG